MHLLVLFYSLIHYLMLTHLLTHIYLLNYTLSIAQISNHSLHYINSGGDSISDIENINNSNINNSINSSFSNEQKVNNKENQPLNLIDHARKSLTHSLSVIHLLTHSLARSGKLKEYIDSEVLNVVTSEDNDIAQLASKALQKLQNYQSNIDVTNEKRFYRAYDTNKSGMIGFTLTHSLPHLLPPPHSHLYTHSLAHSLTNSLTITHSLLLTHYY